MHGWSTLCAVLDPAGSPGLRRCRRTGLHHPAATTASARRAARSRRIVISGSAWPTVPSTFHRPELNAGQVSSAWPPLGRGRCVTARGIRQAQRGRHAVVSGRRPHAQDRGHAIEARESRPPGCGIPAIRQALVFGGEIGSVSDTLCAVLVERGADPPQAMWSEHLHDASRRFNESRPIDRGCARSCRSTRNMTTDAGPGIDEFFHAGRAARR